MAIMYPKNIELYNATLSEKKVYKAFQEQLPDSFTVFYSISWVDNVNGRKKESECDFLIYSEQDGFLTCEVKGGKSLKVENGIFILEEKDGQRILTRSPMAQAEESSRYFYDLYSKEYNDSFNGIYGSFTIFPFYNVNDPVLMDHRPKDIVLDQNDIGNLYKKIKKIFAFYRSQKYYGSLTKNQRRNFANMINKKIAAQASAGAIVEAKEVELSNVNRMQDNFVWLLKNQKRTFIIGGAGTGKTWLALKFAKRAALEGKSVLITCYSIHLVHFFKTLLNTYDVITILSFKELIERDEISVSENLPLCVLKQHIQGKMTYDTVIVDEAQDFNEYCAGIVGLYLRDPQSSEFRVFYDQTQNLLGNDFKKGFDITLPPFMLRENLRNTASIYNWATEKTNLGKDVITNQIIGPLPISFRFNNLYDAQSYIEGQILKLVDEEGIKVKSIVFLIDHDYYDSYNGIRIGRWILKDGSRNDRDSIKLALVEDFKGLESDIVFYIHALYTPEVYNYVAFTRAKYYLYDMVMA